MHPTADTNDVILRQRCRAAGDAGRYGSAPGSDDLQAAFAPLNVARLDRYPHGVGNAPFVP
jgi:hypothetical protein